MEQYPTIQHRSQVKTKGEVFYAFDKLDGSNVRVEWTKKNGFHKFGRRKALLDNSNEFLPLILSKYAEGLEEVFLKQRWPLVTVFFEFFGPTSFAGNHVHEPHDVVLLDVRPFKKGILPPREFLKLFNDMDIPKLLHKGPMSQEFIEAGDKYHDEDVGLSYKQTFGEGFLAYLKETVDGFAWNDANGR